MSVEVVVTITGSSVEDVQSQINDLKVSPTGQETQTAAAGSASSASPTPAAADSVAPTPENPSTPPSESQQPPWAPSSS